MRRLIFGRALLDGNGGAPRAGEGVLTDAQTIVRVGPVEQLKAEADEVVDLGEVTLLPGFVDAHSHVTIRPGEGDQHGQLRSPAVWQALRGVRNMRRVLRSGVTTLRVMAEEHSIDHEFKHAIARGELAGPRLLVSGRGLSPTHGHGGSLKGVDGPDELRRAVRENIRNGADLIKIFATGGVSSTGLPIEASNYTREEIDVVVAEAHRLGRPVAAHAHGGEGVNLCVEAGVDCIEHGALLSDENVRRMKERNTWLVLTNSILFHSTGIEQGDAANPGIIAKVMQARSVAEESFARARAAGLRFALGTDSMHGLFGHEIEWLVRHGVPPEEAIAAATRRGAEVLGLATELGTLEAGKRADLVALRGDPLVDITAVYRVAAVYQGGELVVDGAQRIVEHETA